LYLYNLTKGWQKSGSFSQFNVTIDSILQSFQHFGVCLGLERIETLLSKLGNPHQQVRVIHVAGTNGKGSVCAYLSSILKEAGYRVGRYISPHLLNWNERICINDCPISSPELEQLLQEVIAAIATLPTSPTQFEVITAAAWLYFAQKQVDIAVIEVGLGGRLDATNVCDRPLVTIITSISRDHWQVLGDSLAAIAGEKAGILKPRCPAVIGLLPDEAMTVVKKRLEDLGCSAVFPQVAKEIKTTKALSSPREEERWVEYEGIKYPLPLLGEFQLANSAVAITCIRLLQQQGYSISSDAIALGMANTKWPGRLQWTTWKNHPLLLDGAHNCGSAQVLRQYIESRQCSITWVMGMLANKDCAEIFRLLLRSRDRLLLVPIPDADYANPDQLAILAQNICPDLSQCQPYPDLPTALNAAFTPKETLTVLCGSLYLIGHFLSLRH
jgi:dihydrofolate synthase / folylpolyglutamate synthase